MKTICIIAIYFNILFCAEILLIDGTILNGKIITSTDNMLEIKVSYSDEILKINRNNVVSINFQYLGRKNTPKPAPQLPSDFSFVAANIEEAGENVVKFKNTFRAGFIIQFISTTIMLLYPENLALKNIFLVGTISGGLIQIISLDKAGMAGVYLDEAAYELEKLDQ